MAGIKITDLPAAPSAQLTDVFPVDQLPGPVTYKESNSQLLTLFKANGEALTKTDDANVTLTLGGSPTIALLNPASLTLGWTGTLSPSRGGTGVNNGSNTITLGGNLTTSGSFSSTFTMTGNTSVTFPTSGTLATVGGSVPSIQGTANQVLVNGTSGSPVSGTAVTLTTPQNIATTSSPTFSALTLTNPLTVANGGTGLATLNTYRMLAGGTTATGNLQQVVSGTAGQLLQSNGAGVLPSWTTATFPSGSGTLNHMLRSDGTNWVQTTATTLDSSDVLSGLTQVNVDNLRLDGNTISSTDTNGNINIIPNGTGSTLIGSLTSYATSPGACFLQVAEGGVPGVISVGDFVNNANAPVISFVKSRSTTIGSFVTVQNSDVLASMSFFGDDGTSLVLGARLNASVTASVSTGIIPTQVYIDTMNTSGVLTRAVTISNAQIMTLANALPVGSGGLGITSTPSNGQIPIGNGTTYTAATISAGTNISVTNGAGTITIAATGAASFSWSTISGTSQSAAVQTGYIPTNAGLTTITLPTTFAVGDRISVQGQGSGGWTINAGASRTVQVGSSATSSGGTVSSTNRYDSINLIGIVANSTWATLGGPQSSGLTIA